MSTSRRDFLVRSAAAASALGLGLVPRVALGDEHEPSGARAAKPLNILILGGTGFTGPEQVNYALAPRTQCHAVQSQQDASRHVQGQGRPAHRRPGRRHERAQGKEVRRRASTTRRRLPSWVRNAAQYIKGNAGHYIFISTISVYPDNAPRMRRDGAYDADARGLDPYTPVRRELRPLLRRAQVVLGAGSRRSTTRASSRSSGRVSSSGRSIASDRFTYWPARIERGGEVLAPGDA